MMKTIAPAFATRLCLAHAGEGNNMSRVQVFSTAAVLLVSGVFLAGRVMAVPAVVSKQASDGAVVKLPVMSPVTRLGGGVATVPAGSSVDGIEDNVRYIQYFVYSFLF